jgi:hypothetical protein
MNDLNAIDLSTAKSNALRALCDEYGVPTGSVSKMRAALVSYRDNMNAGAPVEAPAALTGSSKVAQAVADGLGAIAWWDLYDTQVSPTRLRSILAHEGLNVDVPDIDQGAAVRRAAREWHQGRGNADRYRAEVVHETATTLRIGLLKREQVSDDEVKWEQVDAIEFDVVSAMWSTMGTTELANGFITLADERRAYHDHMFIRPAILMASLAQMGAFGLRRQGGCYYVPIQKVADLERLQRVIGAIGNCALDYTHVAATDAGRAALGKEATATLEQALTEVAEQLDSWSESTRKVGTNSEASMLATFADIRARANLYTDALSMSLDAIVSKVEEAEQRARDIIAGKATTDDGTERKSYKPTTATDKNIARAKALVDAALDTEHGKFATVEAVQAAGFSMSATKYASDWSTGYSLDLAFASLGKRAKLLPGKGVLITDRA